ncbi:MAG: hypothetical protein IPF99_37725 [Deltaproteobacteria bacterium]|nr:hypothetical protein [Deltaproteobacteria bacterium]
MLVPSSTLILDRREIEYSQSGPPRPHVVAVAGVGARQRARGRIEPARRVFARLERGGVAVRGELVVFAGNVARR